MLTTAIPLLLAAAGLTTAAPASLTSRQSQAPNYPARSSSNAFKLVVNVTANDFTPSINGYLISGYHSGAGTGFAVAVPPTTSSSGFLFYENSTSAHAAPSTVLTDAGTPASPYSIQVAPSTQSGYQRPGQHDVYVSVGTGSNIGLARFPNPIPQLTGPALGTYAVCNSTLLNGVPAFNVVYAYQTFTSDPYATQDNVPEGCATVTLLPKCEQLNELPAGSYSSHEFASTEGCYADPAAIDWSHVYP